MSLPEPLGAEPQETHERRTASVRRAPKIGVFIGVGAIVGIIVTVAVTTAFPADPDVGMWATVAYMGLYGVTGGIVLGAVAALIADRASRRRARLVDVERGTVAPPPAASGVASPLADLPGPEPESSGPGQRT